VRSIPFTKMQGLGNDFVVLEGPIRLDVEQIRALCDRRRGVGADGVLVVTDGDPIRMEYWNADGSPAEMCGNGLRCVARYAYDKGWAADRNFSVQTPIGVRGVRVLNGEVEADMGRPRLEGSITIHAKEYEIVDLGNPHAVTFVDDLAGVNVDAGASLQTEFANGSNIEFVSVHAGRVEMRVWERGVGETLACGTGIAAVAAVARERYGLESPVAVSVPGGSARVEFRDGAAWLIARAEYSFRGSVDVG
jgi:diaminopimelate epimerase